jgi:oligopeptide transport system substrate-binding protein
MTILLMGCQGGKDKEGKGDASGTDGTGVYGDTLHLPQTQEPQTLYPFAVTDLVSSHVVTQMHEGLFKFDPRTMEAKEALLEEHEVSKDGTVHTFTLKDSIYFHPDPCFANKEERLIRSEDVRFSLELLLTPNERSANYLTKLKDRIKGADEFFAGEADEISGFEKLDERSFRIELDRPSSSFQYILSLPAASIVPQEAVEEDGTDMKVGAGPFKFTSFEENGNELVLERFEDYHMRDSSGKQLPYLQAVHFHFTNSKVQQLENFKSGKVDMIHGLPANKVKSVVQEDIEEFTGNPPRFILSRVPEMSTQFYEFNLTKKVFQDVHVRKAFSYAIDRDSIVKHVLNGEASGPGHHGLTPPTFEDYDIEEIEGYSFDPEKAREHLKKAGYPEGEGFPSTTVQLNRGGGKNTRVAIAIQNHIEDVLNIHLDLEMVSFSKKLENAKNAKGDIWRSAWIADYPSPENFLWLAYGGQVPDSKKEPSWPNTTRYQNPRFDKFYSKGVSSPSKDSAHHYFKKAEQVLMEDAPMIILWYGEKYRMIHSNVQNFHANPMKYYDLRQVHLKEPKKKERKAESSS